MKTRPIVPHAWDHLMTVAAWVLVGLGTMPGPATAAEGLIHLPLQSAVGSAQPHLARGPDGMLVLSWLEVVDGSAQLRFARLQGNTWSAPSTVAGGSNWFVNWADFPSVQPVSESLWAAHWLQKTPGSAYSYHVFMALSHDSGMSWGKPFSPHTDLSATEHGFVSLFPSNGGVGAVWLDGRNTNPSDAGQDHASATHSPRGAMTLRSAQIDGGSRVTTRLPVDEQVCDCCQTDVALSGDTAIAAYRNRTPDEIRDIFVARLVDGAWSDGKAVAEDGWQISGCPVNGPAIDADGERVVVAWFTAAAGVNRVRAAQSINAGRSFGPAWEIDRGDPLGRVDVVVLPDGSIVVSWLRLQESGLAEIVVRQVSANGSPGSPYPIASTSAGRHSGFPQMALQRDRLVLAWTTTDDETTRIQSAALPLAQLSSSSVNEESATPP